MADKSHIQTPFPLATAHIQLERAATAPLHQQLYDQLREAILSQKLEPGSQLPATRRLATTLGISRNTVMNAVDQLHAEGYLESQVGAGTFVSSQLPEELLEARNAPARPATPAEIPTRTLSRRGQHLNQARRLRPVPPAPPTDPVHFDPGVAAVDAFPFDTWARLHRRFCRSVAGGLAEQYLDSAGYQPLRASIARFLKASRAIDCTAEQIVITSGSQQALYLAAQVLLDPGDEALVEEPGYNGATLAIRASSGRVIPLPVDDEGLSIQLARMKAPGARVAFVTPSHQFPLGITTSLRRRLEILTWAEQNDGWIVEDDYDSLYRYEGQPLAALQGLDKNHRVLYVGTFSKVMFPGLRLGYIVVPPDIVEAFLAMRSCIDLHPSAPAQAVMHQFIADGHFARHLRRMLNLYGERREHFVAAAQAQLSDWLTLGPSDSGMHITGLFHEVLDDEAVWLAGRRRGIRFSPLSRHFYGTPTLAGITFGFANLAPDAIDRGLARLAAAIREVG